MMTPEIYREKSKYNLTKLIEQSFISDNQSLKDIITTVDFSEVTKLNFQSELSSFNEETEQYETYGLHNNLIEESLALNCIKLLPLEYYKPYITTEWLLFDNKENYSICHAALGSKKYDFLNYMFDITTEKYNSVDIKDESFSSYANDYSKKMLGSILNIGKFLSDASLGSSKPIEEYEQYYSLFKKAINQFPSYYYKHINSIYVNPKSVDKSNLIDSSNWFLKFNHITQMFYNFDKKEEILKYMLKDSNAFPIYLDIYNQLESTNNNPIKNINVLEQAVLQGNANVVKHLMEQLDISTNTLSELINKNLKELTTNFEAQYDQKLGELKNHTDYEHYISKMTALFSIINMLPNYEVTDWSMIASVSLLKSETVKNFMSKYPEIQTENLMQNSTISEWLEAENSFQNFMEEKGVKFKTFKNEQNKEILSNKLVSYDLLLVSKLKKYIKPTEVNKDRKYVVHDLIAKNYLNWTASISDKEKANIFSMFVLDGLVEKKESVAEIKKLKI